MGQRNAAPPKGWLKHIEPQNHGIFTTYQLVEFAGPSTVAMEARGTPMAEGILSPEQGMNCTQNVTTSYDPWD